MKADSSSRNWFQMSWVVTVVVVMVSLAHRKPAGEFITPAGPAVDCTPLAAPRRVLLRRAATRSVIQRIAALRRLVGQATGLLPRRLAARGGGRAGRGGQMRRVRIRHLLRVHGI